MSTTQHIQNKKTVAVEREVVGILEVFGGRTIRGSGKRIESFTIGMIDENVNGPLRNKDGTTGDGVRANVLIEGARW